jgi:hypothetical protein
VAPLSAKDRELEIIIIIIIIITIIITIDDPSGRAVAGIVGSNPAGGMYVCLLKFLCVIR